MFLRTLLILYQKMGFLSPKIESRTSLLLNNGFKNRTCCLKSFLKFSRMMASKCCPSLESPRELLISKEIPGSHLKTIEAESLAGRTKFPW